MPCYTKVSFIGCFFYKTGALIFMSILMLPHKIHINGLDCDRSARDRNYLAVWY